MTVRMMASRAAATVSLGALVLGGASGALADFSSTNSGTGSGSSNTNTGFMSWVNSLTWLNLKNVANGFSFSSTSGGNTANGNTLFGGLNSGGFNGTLNFLNLPATPFVLPTITLPSFSGGGTNSTTGANSSNSNTFTVTGSNTANVSSLSTVTNSISVSSNSGGNNVNNNTSAGTVTTGGGSLNVTIGN